MTMSIFEFLQQFQSKHNNDKGLLSYDDKVKLYDILNTDYYSVTFQRNIDTIQMRLQEIIVNEEVPGFSRDDWIWNNHEQDSVQIWVTTEEQAILLRLII